MLLSEEDAKHNWCPFARVMRPDNDGGVAGTFIAATVNRDGMGQPPSDCLCIASACMAWRAAETREFQLTAEREFRKTGKRMTPDTGYCGLAGIPTVTR